MWPFGKRKARDLADDLHLALSSEQPTQAGMHEDAPGWAIKLLWLFVRLWPNPIVQVILAILEAVLSKLSTEDKAEAMWAINRYRRVVNASPNLVAASALKGD